MILFEQIENLFGFGLEKKKKPATPELKTFTLDSEMTADGTVLQDYAVSAGGGISSISYDAAQVPVEELDLINTYRNMAMSAEIDEALQEIRNEIMVFDVPGELPFNLEFMETKDAPPESIKKKIVEEFHNIYQLLDFHNKGTDYFDSWYIDSKLYFHKIVDEKELSAGIQRVLQIDPLKIRKVRLIPRPLPDGTIDVSQIKEIFVYSNRFPSNYTLSGVTDLYYGTNLSGLQISPDAITYVDSGLMDRALGRYVGHLKKAILPFNNMRMMEDAMLIFRVVRAPQRRAIYIDVSSMQKNKAEQYMKDMMARFKNKMVYDSKTGSMSDRRNIQSMMEDYWLPRRDGGRGTEIQTLEGQDSSSALQEVEYYRDKLWRALNVPRSRFAENPTSMIFGKGIEIQRDEYRFRKFLDRLRRSFMRLFDDMLKTQLILKRVIEPDEWEGIRRTMFWTFTEDNAFVEYKESEIINNRVQMLQSVDPYVGKYFSAEWVRRKILRFSDDEIKDEDKRIDQEPDWTPVDAPPDAFVNSKEKDEQQAPKEKKNEKPESD